MAAFVEYAWSESAAEGRDANTAQQDMLRTSQRAPDVSKRPGYDAVTCKFAMDGLGCRDVFMTSQYVRDPSAPCA